MNYQTSNCIFLINKQGWKEKSLRF